MLNRIKSEPALVSGALQAAIGLAVVFGVPLSPEQTGAILALSAALLAFVVRSKVTPTASPDAGEGGAGDTTLLLLVVILLGVTLLLFGVRLG